MSYRVEVPGCTCVPRVFCIEKKEELFFRRSLDLELYVKFRSNPLVLPQHLYPSYDTETPDKSNNMSRRTTRYFF